MTFRRSILVALLWCCCWLTVPAAERHMPVSEIRPGMVGVGRTVFAGDTLEEFTVRILGVLPNTIAPGRDLILARLEGGPLARTGVIAGMSGSPVYIDGRLVGAVSYQLGSFPTEPIAGITPIAEMIDAARGGSARQPGATVTVPRLADAESFRRVLAAIRPAARLGSPSLGVDKARVAVSSLDAGQAGGLRRIATPVSASGLTPAFAAVFFDALGDAGLVPAPTSAIVGGRADTAPVSPLRPGDPVGVTLASGDYTIGATGTVTDVDAGAVYAFGHPFFGLGPARLPMTTAVVHTILPSLTSSMKIASTGPVVGAFTQDRATVLAGRLGDRAATIPVSLALTSAGGAHRTLTFDVSVDPFFTPLITFVGMGSALATFERELGVNTYALRARLDVAGQAPITIDDVFTGDGASSEAASAVALPIAALLSNDREPVTFERLTIEVTATEHLKTSTIQRVWIDTPDLRPGRPAIVKVLLRPYRGPDEVKSVPIHLPAWNDGPLTLVVASGPNLAQFETRDGLVNPPPASVAGLVGQLQQVRRHNRVYVRLYARDTGAVVDGAAMPGLPNSVQAVLDSDKAAGGGTSTAATPAGAWDVVLDTTVTGVRTLTITPTLAPRLP